MRAPGTCPPPPPVQIFSFSCSFGGKLAKIILLWLAPFLWEILDPPLINDDWDTISPFLSSLSTCRTMSARRFFILAASCSTSISWLSLSPPLTTCTSSFFSCSFTRFSRLHLHNYNINHLIITQSSTHYLHLRLLLLLLYPLLQVVLTQLQYQPPDYHSVLHSLPAPPASSPAPLPASPGCTYTTTISTTWLSLSPPLTTCTSSFFSCSFTRFFRLYLHNYNINHLIITQSSTHYLHLRLLLLLLYPLLQVVLTQLQYQPPDYHSVLHSLPAPPASSPAPSPASQDCIYTTTWKLFFWIIFYSRDKLGPICFSYPHVNNNLTDDFQNHLRV